MYFTEAELIGISTSSTPPLTVNRGGSIIKCYPNQAIADLHAAGRLKVGDRLMLVSVDADFATAYAVDKVGVLSAGPAPASFQLSGLNISPSEVKPGESVTISVTIKNIGGTTGNYTAVFKIDGVDKTLSPVTVAPGGSVLVATATSSTKLGVHIVETAGMTVSFTVVEKPATATLIIKSNSFPTGTVITPAIGTYTKTIGENVRLIAVTSGAYHFYRWQIEKGGATTYDTKNPLEYTVTEDTTITAIISRL